MKTVQRLFVFILLNTLPGITAVFGQRDYANLRTGDKLFEEGMYTDAETSYRKALELNPKPGTNYNLANSLFLQNRIPEAIAEYQKAINSAEDGEVKQRGYYNMGNAYFHNKEYGQSINAYKEALKLNPEDLDAKKNLMLAMRQLKQEQQQQQNEQQQEQQQQQQQNEQKQEEQQQQEQEQQQQQQQQQQQKEDISKEEAKEILKAIEREDQRVQEKLKKTSGKTPPPAKDW